MDKKELEQLLHKEIPITQALGISVSKLDNRSIEVSAPFENNKNIHNTAFAGSIYTTATLAAWSLLTNFLRLNHLNGAVVLAKADMRYLKPIDGDIVAQCHLPDSREIDEFKTKLKANNRSKINLTVEVIEQNRCKAKLIGQFAIV